jgi:hypothetical protein
MSRIDYSGFALAKPAPREKSAKGLKRSGRIKPNPERLAAKIELQEGPHAVLLRACPCAARYPDLYTRHQPDGTREPCDVAIRTILREAARRLAGMGGQKVQRSVAHHTVRRSQGGAAQHLIPLHTDVHELIHQHGDFNAFTEAEYGFNPLTLAERLWALSPAHGAEEGGDL